MLPNINLVSVRAVARDANHNAFTDLVRFGDSLYLTFRTCPDGHGIAPTSSIRVLRSANGSDWEEVHRFSVENRDTRDPHFLVFNDTLFVYSGTWDATPDGIVRREMNEHVGYCVRSGDGVDWSDPVELASTRGHYIWRAAAYGGKAYLCGRRKSGFVSLPSKRSEWAIQESAMLASDDGVEFETVGLFQDSYGDETAFVFADNGEVVALVRCRNPDQPAYICRSAPPFEEWERVQIDRNIGGPMLNRWGNFLLAGGRRSMTDDDPSTVLYWLEEERLEEALVLPSGGDCSYPGFVEIDAQHALVGYYSSHEGSGDPPAPASVYVAEIELEA